VVVDYCPECKGIWLDTDEFEAIIKSLTDELLDKSFSDYIKASLEEAKELIIGPESFISEWKDLATVLRMLEYRFFAEHPTLMTKITDIQRRSPFI